MKVICITGTPGTGKTAIAKKLAKKLDFYHLDVNKLIKKYKLSEGYDRKRKSKIVDIAKLNKKLIMEIKKIKLSKKHNGIVIDSHLSHYIPRKYVDFCIVVKCGINELGKRLKKRGYPKNKILENLQAEIFDVCYNEAIEGKHKVIIIDTSKISKKFSGYSESKILKATKSFNISKIARAIGGGKC